jgi:autotransporter strand-loop-strand O-heptosyltransferase
VKIKIKFVTHTPLTVGSPSITVENSPYSYIEGNITDHHEKIVYNIRLDQSNNFTVFGPKQWFGDWEITLYNPSGEQIHREKFNPKNKTVFIKSDAKALGDNLAWIDYIDQFRIKHECNVICSTFWNDLFIESYPNLMFVQPNTRIDNVYAQYYVGTHNILNPIYQPSLYLDNPLQKIAADILGLEYKESIAKIKLPTHLPKKKQITLSEYASLRVKEWNVVGGWQAIVDYFNSIGFEVIIISKEFSYLKNITNKSGDYPLEDRIKDIYQSYYHIGLSSGLSWLAQSCGTHTFLISDFTPPNHEIQTNTTRIYNENNPRHFISYSEVTQPVTLEHTLNKISDRLKKDGHI